MFFIPLISLSIGSIGLEVEAQQKKAPTNEQVNLYMSLNTIVLCRALEQKIPFKQALSVAVSSAVTAVMAFHDGQVPGGGKVSPEKIANSAALAIVLQGAQNCPDLIPAEEKKKAEEFVKRIKAASKR